MQFSKLSHVNMSTVHDIHHLHYIIILYVQVQCQLFCVKRAFCDFVLWTNEDIHIERIYPDEEFWISCIGKAEVIFKTAILPELLGNFFSRPPKNPISVLPSLSDEPGPSPSTAAESYCYCRGPERDDMIACDNPTCPYVWFHFDCLKLSTTPRTKQWFCPECRKLPQYSRKKRKTN